jgi:2-polyprenyl-6-hydroxyphenyl methylase/3-demethylubiquinone-9 3-methyltransferase
VNTEQAKDRFAFGKNWQKFLAVINDDRISQAEKSLMEMLGAGNLNGKSFLDIGSGSGLFSLAARRLGANVVSFDYDPDSVNCTASLKAKYFTRDTDRQWRVEQASVLDKEYLSSLGRFDIVYSWGVLHHTGAMWDALANVVDCVKPDGLLFISIYNDEDWRSRRNRFVKKFYTGLPNPLKPLMVAGYAALEVLRGFAADALRLRNPLRRYQQTMRSRGMSAWVDMVDWLGGYPFEVAKPEELFDFYTRRGFQLQKLKTVGRGHGCNEFVFRFVGHETQAMKRAV